MTKPLDDKYLGCFPTLTVDAQDRVIWEGQVLPRVTQITHQLSDSGMRIWAEKNPEKMQFACDRGHALHALVEEFLTGGQHTELLSDTSPMAQLVVRPMFHALKPFLEKVECYYAQELRMVSPSLLLSGRVDLVARYEGKLVILDIKGTGQKIRPVGPDYGTQITAYATMWREWTKVPIEEGVILRVTERGNVAEQRLDPAAYVTELHRAITLWKEKSLHDSQASHSGSSSPSLSESHAGS